MGYAANGPPGGGGGGGGALVVPPPQLAQSRASIATHVNV